MAESVRSPVSQGTNMGRKSGGQTISIPLISEPSPIENGMAEESHDPRPSRDTMCGLGFWQPSCLQPFANVKGFTAILAFWSLFGSMNFTYYTAVITQIEKDYGLSSSMSGFVKNVDNIGYILTAVLLSHFFRYSNKPRLFAMATVVSSSAIFLFATPHFFFGHSDSVPPPDINGTASNTTRLALDEFCASHAGDSAREMCGGVGTLKAFNAGALGLFILSEMLQGVGQSPKFTLSMTYIDDNAKNQSPKYFAYMFSMRAFSPVMGFMLGAWTTSVYVDLKDPGFGQKDSRWVGAWWVGFVICAVLSIIWAFPMLLFPANLKQKAGEKAAPEPVSAKEMAKDLPRAFVRLVKNKLYILVVLAICVKITMVGFMTFFPKYLEYHFGLTASIASIVTAVISIASWGIGPILSGAVMSKLNVDTPFKAMKMVCTVMTIVVIGYIILFFLGCPNDKWAGDISGGNMTLACNEQCSCDSVRFQPICGQDGLNYYSPCHAGCTGKSTNTSSTTFTGCGCIPGGRAEIGLCPKLCTMIYPYAVVYGLTTFVGSMAVVPTMSVLMRCVISKDKATSLAMAITIMQIIGFPAPMLAGVVIDTTCLVQQQSACSSRVGACLHYDQDQFRFRMQGMIAVINAVALLFYFVALFFSRNVEFLDDTDDKAADAAEAESNQNGSKPMLDAKQDDEQ